MYIKSPDHPKGTHCFDLPADNKLWAKHWYPTETRSICPLTGKYFPYSNKDGVFLNDTPPIATPVSTYTSAYSKRIDSHRHLSQPIPSGLRRFSPKQEHGEFTKFLWNQQISNKLAKEYVKHFRESEGFDRNKEMADRSPAEQAGQAAVSAMSMRYPYLYSSALACDDKVIIRTSSAALQGQPRRAASCQETAWGVTANKDVDNSHWLTWNTGELEPPGLQTRLAKPYPTPEPPSDYGAKGFVSPKLVRESTPKRRTPNPPATQRPTRTASSTSSQCVVRDAKAGGPGNNYNPSPHPCFRSWHTSHCDGYEAEVTYNMLQHLYGGKSSQLDKMRRNRTGRYEHPINFERKIINGTYRSLESPQEFYGTFYNNEAAVRMEGLSSSQPSGMSMQRAAMDYYPVSYHAPRGGIGRTDHTASSFFQYTQPSVKSSFVIHPQWTSEHCEFSKKLKSTKNLSHLTASKGDNSFRYGSA